MPRRFFEEWSMELHRCYLTSSIFGAENVSVSASGTSEWVEEVELFSPPACLDRLGERYLLRITVKLKGRKKIFASEIWALKHFYSN